MFTMFFFFFGQLYCLSNFGFSHYWWNWPLYEKEIALAFARLAYRCQRIIHPLERIWWIREEQDGENTDSNTHTNTNWSEQSWWMSEEKDGANTDTNTNTNTNSSDRSWWMSEDKDGAHLLQEATLLIIWKLLLLLIQIQIHIQIQRQTQTQIHKYI